MTRGELKSIIKEAILELQESGQLSSGLTSPQQKSAPVNKQTVIEARRVEAAKLATSKFNFGTTPKSAQEANLFSLLEDTARNTVVRDREIDQHGMTMESKENFDSMFPDDLKDHFNNLFGNSVK